MHRQKKIKFRLLPRVIDAKKNHWDAENQGSVHFGMCVCVCIHTCIHTYIHICIYIHTYTHTHMHIYSNIFNTRNSVFGSPVISPRNLKREQAGIWIFYKILKQSKQILPNLKERKGGTHASVTRSAQSCDYSTSKVFIVEISNSPRKVYVLIEPEDVEVWVRCLK